LHFSSPQMESLRSCSNPERENRSIGPYLSIEMEDKVFNLLFQGGPVMVTLGVILFAIVRWGIPILREGLAAHQKSLDTVVEGNKATERAMVEGHKTTMTETLSTFEKQTSSVVDRIGADVARISRDMDLLVVSVDGLRADISTRDGVRPVDVRSQTGPQVLLNRPWAETKLPR
jgi:hypothetical protein